MDYEKIVHSEFYRKVNYRMKICGIYCIFNKVNHKRYIGQSVDINARWSKHKKMLSKRTYIGDNHHLTNSWHKYGEENFELFIVEQCKKSELDAFETFWVNYYDTTNPTKGYNKTQGGKFNYKIQYDRVMNPIKYGEDTNYHILSENDVRQIIECFNTGESSISIAKRYNVNRKTITNIRKGKTWTHLTNGLNLKQSDYYNIHNMVSNNAKIIDMYTLNGDFIKTFPSINQAAEELHVKSSAVSNVCYGKTLSLCGYTFRFHGCDFNSLRIKPEPGRKRIPIDQYDLSWNYIQTFNSIKEAFLVTGIDNIQSALSYSKCIRGGYHWLRHGEKPPIVA